jgi:hypothetical protein
MKYKIHITHEEPRLGEERYSNTITDFEISINEGEKILPEIIMAITRLACSPPTRVVYAKGSEVMMDDL